MSIALKKYFGVTMTQFTRKQIADANALLSKSLPCHVVAVDGAIVTVAFDVTTEFTLPQVKMPVLESEYVRLPVQVGDRGITIGADTLISHITGLGGGAAPAISQPPNLAALVFVPVGNSAWTTRDANAVVIEAPNGAIIRTQDGNSIVTISDTEISITTTDKPISLTCGSTSIQLDGTNVTITGTLVINGKPYLTHQHTGVTIGTGKTGPVGP
jgi:hypothetical protein